MFTLRWRDHKTCDNEVCDEGLVEEEFVDIQAYSQSKCVTLSLVTRVFSQTEEKPKNRDSAYITNGA